MPCGETSSAHDVLPIYAEYMHIARRKFVDKFVPFPSVFSLRAASVFIVLIYRDCV